MSNKIDNAIAKAIEAYSQECEAAGVSRDLTEQGRRINAVFDGADPLDALASAYFSGLPIPTSHHVMRAAILSLAGRRSSADGAAPSDEAAPKPRKSKKKEAE